MLLHHFEDDQVLDEPVVLLAAQSAEVPHVDEAEQVAVAPLDHGFCRVVASSGFMKTPDVPVVLARARARGLVSEPARTSYCLGRERLLPHGTSPMVRWRTRLFALVSRNTGSATELFGLPSNPLVEPGAQIEL